MNNNKHLHDRTNNARALPLPRPRWTDDHYDDYIESVSAKKANETDKADLLEQEKKDEQEWREREEGNA